MTRRSTLALLLAIVAAILAPAVAAQVSGVTVTVPDVTVPTVTVPTITVPSVTSPTPTPTPPPASVPSIPSVPSVSDVSGATSSIGAWSDSGSGSAASGSGSSVSPRAGDARWTVTAKDPELRASRKKFKNVRERGEPYGTTLSFWLNRRGIVRLVIRREAPICDAIGIVTLRAEPGLNRVRFLGRWKRKPLPPGTYSVTGVLVRGGGVRSIGIVRLAIVGHNQDTDDARVRRSRCGAPAGTEAEERVTRLMAGDASFGSLDVQARETIAKEVAAKTVSGSSDRSQLLGPAPRENASGDGGFVVNPLRGVPPWAIPLLLALAAIPLAAAWLLARTNQPTGAAALFVDTRMQIALASAVVLGTVAIALLF